MKVKPVMCLGLFKVINSFFYENFGKTYFPSQSSVRKLLKKGVIFSSSEVGPNAYCRAQRNLN